MTLYLIYCTDEWKTKPAPVASVCTEVDQVKEVVSAMIEQESMNYNLGFPGMSREEQVRKFCDDIDHLGVDDTSSGLEYGYIDIVEAGEILC